MGRGTAMMVVTLVACAADPPSLPAGTSTTTGASSGVGETGPIAASSSGGSPTGGSSTTIGMADGTTTSDATSSTTIGPPATTTDGGGACFPSGPYGICSQNDCECVMLGMVAQTCSHPCTTDADCEAPDPTTGTSPVCRTVGPGDMTWCLLSCADDGAVCPCGMQCMDVGPSTSVCVDPAA